MTPLEKITELADQSTIIDDELINKLVKLTGEDNLHTALEYYFIDHEFDEETYLLSKISPYAKMRVAKFKVERYLISKKKR